MKILERNEGLNLNAFCWNIFPSNSIVQGLQETYSMRALWFGQVIEFYEFLTG